MNKKVLVPVANGTEELEAIAIIDVLRRGGSNVTVASVESLGVVCAKKTQLVADALIKDCMDQPYDMIVLPGGDQGAQTFQENKILKKLLVQQNESGKWVAAICASPAVVLDPFGILKGRDMTCYPSYIKDIKDGNYVNKRVVEDGNLITSQGPGTAVEFALHLVKLLSGEAKATEVQKGIVV